MALRHISPKFYFFGKLVLILVGHVWRKGTMITWNFHYLPAVSHLCLVLFVFVRYLLHRVLLSWLIGWAVLYAGASTQSSVIKNKCFKTFSCFHIISLIFHLHFIPHYILGFTKNSERSYLDLHKFFNKMRTISGRKAYFLYFKNFLQISGTSEKLFWTVTVVVRWYSIWAYSFN